MAYNSEDRKACVRCGAKTFVTDPPHLCKDIVKRQKRQQRQIDAATDLILGHIGNGGANGRAGQVGIRPADARATAVALVALLNKLGVGED